MPWDEHLNLVDLGKKELKDEETDSQRGYVVGLSEASQRKIIALEFPLRRRWRLRKIIYFCHMEWNPVLVPRRESNTVTHNPACRLKDSSSNLEDLLMNLTAATSSIGNVEL